MTETWPDPPALTTVATLPCTSWVLGPAYEMPASCQPTNWDEYGGDQYYSPGICFSGWTVGCSVSFYSDWGTTRLRPIQSDETAMMCVPEGFDCWSLTHVAAATTPVPSSVGTWQPLFQIRWKSSDLSHLETHPLTPGLRMIRSADATVTFTSLVVVPATQPARTNSPGVSAGTHYGGLSAAAKAGIGVGAAVVGLLLLIGTILFIRRRRSSLAKKGGEGTIGHDGPHELDPSTTKTVAELGGEGEKSRNMLELDAGKDMTIPQPVATAAELSPAAVAATAVTVPEMPDSSPTKSPRQFAELYAGQPWSSFQGQAGHGPSHHSSIQALPSDTTHHSSSYYDYGYNNIDMQSTGSPHAQTMVSQEPDNEQTAGTPASFSTPQDSESAAELARLKAEYEELESQRRTLLRLRQVEEEQAALKERIAVAERSLGQGSGG
ncbi:hypothetical protein B0H66DRAFT_532629 [Apodospora peruviana]|uniref:Uncharacterized protein n=1 Tax=Apodospora peruviana TaxID=516989 RepID=A0AAE0I4M6_9PEZI|nr:hypothetical protein B0H66DRAFT_532629 [Apodospora peruviana]